MKSGKNRIYAIGAFDRFNYGDLLFPVIAKKLLEEKYSDVSLEGYALISSDYSQYGALKTKPIRDLYKRGILNENDIIYFAGGGTIGSDYCDMHSNLVDGLRNTLLYYFQRLFGGQIANYFSRLYFGARSNFPWLASPSDFLVPVKVIYNSIGGSEFSKLEPKIQKAILKKLSKAAYLSVRDAETKKLLAPIEAKIPVNLAPDSATLMSEQFPRKDLKKKVSIRLQKLISQAGYVCFQSNNYYTRKNINEIIAQLENIYYSYGFRAILLPLGRYAGLDDYVGLNEIKLRIKTPTDIIGRDASIWDSMYTIANSRMFLGTSLHGNITAQSFAVPHIGLSEKRCKVDFYLETWDIPEYSCCVSINKIHKAIDKTLAISDAILQKKRKELIALTNSNFEKIAHVFTDN